MTSQTALARASYNRAMAIIERIINAQPALTDSCLIYLVFGLKGLGATQQSAGQRRGRGHELAACRHVGRAASIPLR